VAERIGTGERRHADAAGHTPGARRILVAAGGSTPMSAYRADALQPRRLI
jgi:hypothetical protein